MKINSDCVAIVSGAGSGIGQQLVWQLVEKNVKVFALEINEKSLRETLDNCSINKHLIETISIDVADENSIKNWTESVQSSIENKPIILINNAGVSLFSGYFEHTDLKDFRWLMNINFWGAVYTVKYFLETLKKSPMAYIVNVSSVFGLGGVESNSAYCASKFALRGFTETLRMELQNSTIKTLLVLPGSVDTGIVQNAKLSSTYMTENMKQETVTQFAQRAKTKPLQAAKQILKSIESDKEQLIIGYDGKIFSLITRIFPVLYSKIMKSHLRRRFKTHYE